MNLMQANRQWSTRPEDERFTSLLEMQSTMQAQRSASREVVVSSRKIEVAPTDDNKGLLITGPNGHAYAPTHYAFGQLATLAQAPGGYLRTIPAPIAADCINYGLQLKRGPEDVGVLLYKNGGEPVMRAATGPRYGRIWNEEIVSSLVAQFGDGVNGDFRVPGEFKQRVTVTKENTTLFAGDRDMFVFLADEERRIEVPGRRDGKAGSLARGFFVWNSEVGSATFGVAGFLFDYVCCNRIVWGAEQFKQITIRHTASAPDKWVEEMKPALLEYSRSSTANIEALVVNARKSRIDNVDEFLAKRFGSRTVAELKAVHEQEEGRPIETLWDASTAVTAKAKSIKWQDDRVELEREGGKILALAA